MITSEIRRRVQRATICWRTASRNATGPEGSSFIISEMVALEMTSRARWMRSRSRSPMMLIGISDMVIQQSNESFRNKTHLD